MKAGRQAGSHIQLLHQAGMAVTRTSATARFLGKYHLRGSAFGAGLGAACGFFAGLETPRLIRKNFNPLRSVPTRLMIVHSPRFGLDAPVCLDMQVYFAGRA